MGRTQSSDLLEFHLARSGWLLAIVAHAFFDESGAGDESPDLCMAGYIFKKEAAVSFDEKWSQMLRDHGLNFFHMKECAMPEGANGPAGFGPLTIAQRDAAAREAIGLIQRYASRGIAISLDKSVAAGIMEGGIWPSPYAFVSGQTLYGVRAWAHTEGLEGAVAYFFESGAQGWGQAQEAACRLAGMDDRKFADSFRIASFTSMPGKGDSCALQAADMLAWHWRKHCQNVREGKKKRKDFAELLKVPTDAHHYDQSAVEFLGLIRASGSPVPRPLCI